jgi:AraC family transcriptional regulator
MLPLGNDLSPELRTPGIKMRLTAYPAGVPLAGYTVFHNHNVLTFILKKPRSVMVRQQGGRRSALEEIGAISFLPRNIPWELSAPPGPWLCLNCEFDDDEMFDYAVGDAHSWNRHAFETSCNIRSNQILQVFRLLEGELRSPTFSSSVIIETLATTTLYYLARYFGGATDLRASRSQMLTPLQLRKIENRLEDLEGGPPLVRELAHLCGLSERHLLRKYKNTTGRTLGNYIAQTRVARSKRLLSRTSLCVKTIAHQLGFNSPSSFGVAFRRELSETPIQFRHRIQGGDKPNDPESPKESALRT